MNTLLQSDVFRDWFGGLKDLQAKAVILNRLDRAAKGAFGDVKALGGGLMEMRVNGGPGYRVYYTRRGATLYLLLAGGDKSTQHRDLTRARTLMASIPEE